MKNHLFAAALAASAAFAFSGCVTEVRVENSSAPKAEWVHFISGDLVVRYPGKTQKELLDASNKALDQYLGTNKRVGENWPEDNPSLPPSYEIFARTEGDVKIVITITTETATASDEPVNDADAKDKAAKPAPKEWTQVNISYGAFGNLPESQKLVEYIAKNLN